MSTEQNALYRGKRCDNGEWIEGSLIVEPHRARIFKPHSERSSTCVDVDFKTVGQFTRVVDKNKNKIFHGDIFTNGDINIKYIVELTCDGFRGRQIRNKSMIGLAFWKENIEVIGNKTDNPELQ